MKFSITHISAGAYRAILVTLVFIAMSVLIAVSCSDLEDGFDDKKDYERLLSSPLHTLLDKARTHFESGSLDSSYVAYTAIASRYNSGMKEEDKILCARALNNAAYIAHIHYHDYPQAYALSIKALEIADDLGNRRISANMYINIGNLMCASGNWDEGMNYQQQAMDVAIENKDTVNYLKGLANLMIEALLEDRISEYGDVVADFPRLSGYGPLWSYNTKLNEVAEAQLSGDLRGVKEGLQSMAAEDESGIAPAERLLFFRNFVWAKTLGQNELYRDAVNHMRYIESLNIREPELQSYLYKAMADYYKTLGMLDSAANYKLRYAELADSLRSDTKQSSIYEMRRTYENRSVKFRMEALLKEQRALMRTVWIVSVFSAVVLILLVWLYLSRRNVVRARREIYARNQELLSRMEDMRAPKPTTTGSICAETVDEELLERIKAELQKNEEIYSPDFSAERLASLLGVPLKKLSRTINEGMGQNFSTTLQTYRIREACRRLSDTGRYGNVTIEAIAESVGFRSRSNFNTVFKKLTGLTPAAWQKIAKSKRG